MGWLLILTGIIGIVFARRITRRVILLRFVAVWILLAGVGALVGPEPTKTSHSGAPSNAVPAPAPEAAPKAPRGIGRSYDQITSFPPEVFPQIESSPLRDGRPRMLLTTKDNLAILEVIGPKDFPEKASLSVAVPNNSSLIVTKHALLVMAFLDNVAPEWGERRSWATDALRRAVDSPGAEEQVTQGGTTISIRFLRPLNMVQIFVSPSP